MEEEPDGMAFHRRKKIVVVGVGVVGGGLLPLRPRARVSRCDDAEARPLFSFFRSSSVIKP